ncbi:MAG: MFS transporter [Deltaproteobacteria bacterium]|nr:MAG: MFS transporter [Deltaproteobacteria bacterium]
MVGTAHAAPRLDLAERRFVLLFLPVAIGFGGRMALIAFNGPLAQRFTDNGYLIGLLLATGPLVSALVNPAVGRLSDRTWTRFGRRMPYALVGVPLSTLVLFAIPSSPGYAALLGLFLLRAVSISVGGVPLMSIIPDRITSAARGRAMSLFLLAGGVGAIAIQAAGKLYWERDFALVFYLTGALALVFAVPPLFFIREPRPSPEDLRTARGASRLGPRAMLAAVVRADPMALFLVSATLRYLGAGIIVTYLTLFAVTDLDVAVGDAALAMAVAGGVRLALALPAGRLADTQGRKGLVLGATIASAVLYLLTALAVRDLAGLYAVLLVAAVIGTIEMTASGPLFMDLLPAHRRGELTGVNMVLGNVCRGVGALLGGAAFAWTGGYRASYATAALCFAVSALILARLRVAPPPRTDAIP